MSAHEELSRLLEGELDPEAEAELRGRIAADPALREAWERLQRLPFAALLAADPPPELDLRVLAAARRRPTWAWVPWAVAAAALLALAVQARERPLVLEAENAVLRKLLQDAEAEAHGVRVAWPPDLPEALLPAAFERNLRAAVAECAPQVEIVALDCAEPPCLASLRVPGGGAFAEGRTWWDDLVNECELWTGPYTHSVSSASVEVTCADGERERMNVLGWSTHLAPDAFPEDGAENRHKRFQARIDELRRTWRCAGG